MLIDRIPAFKRSGHQAERGDDLIERLFVYPPGWPEPTEARYPPIM